MYGNFAAPSAANSQDAESRSDELGLCRVRRTQFP